MAHDLLKQRIRIAAGQPHNSGNCVLYIMSRDQRVHDNHALLAAQEHALKKKLPLAVIFCLREGLGYRSQEHFTFMLEGLYELETELNRFDIPFMLVYGDPGQKLTAVLHHTRPDAVYLDFSPLKGARKLEADIKEIAKDQCGVYVVDTHNIVPVWRASSKKEAAAYTLRPKIHAQIVEFLVEPEQIVKHPYAWPGVVRSLDDLSSSIQQLVASVHVSGISVPCKSGERMARKELQRFIRERLEGYAMYRNDPARNHTSHLSAYLHFGHISSLRIALQLREYALKQGTDLHICMSPKMPQSSNGPNVLDSSNAFLEELIVRKELADNFCWYEERYDTIDAIPLWARQTLRQHGSDPREHLYSYSELCHATTHDRAWNAAQRQLTQTGNMHGYMRMYWAKKVLEWTESPEQALAFLIRLNDTYSLDGGDPNGYVGILWSIGGVHDRPWTERDIFGKVRYMNYSGLKRKFDIASYERMYDQP